MTTLITAAHFWVKQHKTSNEWWQNIVAKSLFGLILWCSFAWWDALNKVFSIAGSEVMHRGGLSCKFLLVTLWVLGLNSGIPWGNRLAEMKSHADPDPGVRHVKLFSLMLLVLLTVGGSVHFKTLWETLFYQVFKFHRLKDDTSLVPT